MKKIVLIISLLAVVGIVIALLWGGEKKVEEVGDIAGVYEGEAVVQMDEKLKAFAEQLATQNNVALPEGPLVCKIGVEVDESNKVTMELVDFKLPVEGVTLEPSQCTATKAGNGFAVTGEGKLKYGIFGITYTHEGTIAGETLNAELKMAVPMSGNLTVTFEGKKI